MSIHSISKHISDSCLNGEEAIYPETIEDVAQKASNVYSEATSGEIFLLTGSSSAGKTSIINLFSKETGAEPLGADEYDDMIFFKKRYPDDYKILKNVISDESEILRAIFTGKLPELPEDSIVTSEEQESADAYIASLRDSDFAQHFSEALMEDHFKTILEAARAGKTIILDTLHTKPFFNFLREENYTDKVTHLMIYLPLETLVERVKVRNRDPSNHRDIGMVLNDFQRLYRPRESIDEPVVDTITRETIMGIYEDNEAALRSERERGFRPCPRDEYLKLFGFTDGVDNVEITSTLNARFSGIFHTAFQETHEIIHQLKDRAWEKLV